jgi:phage gp45-like
MSKQKAAKTYPNTIFTQTTPDENQELTGNPRYQTWYKGYLTKSEVYERMMPDGLTSALRIDGPDSGGAAVVMNSKGNIKLITGKRNDVAGSGTLDIRTSGCNQLHEGRTNIQYNEGGSENEGQALNILCYGDVVEQAIGSTRYIKASKIEITATEELVLNGQTIKMQAQGDIEMAAASVTTAQVNKKEIVIGQSMKFGAGEDTDLQFDPRASKNIISPGNVNHKVLGDYKIKSLRKMSVNAVTGLFMSSPATTTVQGLASMVVNGPGGMNLKSAKTTFETADFNVVSAKTDFKTADFNLDAAKLDLTGTGDVSITGANVKITGALIYLN